MIRLPSYRLAMGALLLGVFACERTLDFYPCDDPCRECDEPCKCPEGDCVPVPPAGWEGPMLLWTGPQVEAPPCPDRAINVVYEGHADLHARNTCPQCECGPPACELPAGLVANSSDMCGIGNLMPFNAPDGWTGTCVSPGTILEAQFTSIAIVPPTVRSCEPSAGEPVPAQGSVDWEVFARACRSADSLMACNDPTKHCAPTSRPPPPGFSHCLYKEGEQETCPEHYPNRHVFYGDTEGELGCTDCQCGPPEGSDCSVVITAYSDIACMDELVIVGPVNVESSVCVQGMTPGDLRSMSATVLADVPGACAPSGGETFGEIVPVDPSTFCCQLRDE